MTVSVPVLTGGELPICPVSGPVSDGGPEAAVEPLFFFTDPHMAAMVAARLPRPVYAVMPIRLDRAMSLAPSVELAAPVYGRALLARQPTGPVHLLGLCATGVIVYEVARWLRGQGRTVRFLGLVDTVHPGLFGDTAPPLAEIIESHLYAHAVLSGAADKIEEAWQRRRLSAIDVVEALDGAFHAAVASDVSDPDALDPSVLLEFTRRAQAFLLLALAAYLHRPGDYPGELTFVRNTVGLDSIGRGLAGLSLSEQMWRDGARGGFRSFVVDDMPRDDPHRGLLSSPGLGDYLAAALAR